MQSISPLTKSANNKISPSTNHLSQLQNRIPTVSDKALINLVNGIQVSKDMIRYRKNRGFLESYSINSTVAIANAKYYSMETLLQVKKLYTIRF